MLPRIPLRPALASASRPRPTLPQRRFWHRDPNFRPPPIRERLRPLVPFLVYWTVVTSLAVNLLRTRKRSEEELGRSQAQISVLEGLVRRLQASAVGDDEVQRELEMVGLRQREVTTEMGEEMKEGGYVGWKEALLGRKGKDRAVDEEEAVREWVEVVNESTRPAAAPLRDLSAPLPLTLPPAITPEAGQTSRAGETRRAPSSRVYM